MSSIHLVIGDSHAHPDFPNDRADWLSRLIIDVRPDVVVNIGDAADMPSLAQMDKGRTPPNTRSYQKDIASHCDFQGRIWEPILARKKKLPRRVFLHGNHEQRIQQAVWRTPELSETISYGDLRLGDWYDDIVPYEGVTPGSISIDGITYAHYMVAGVSGRPVSSEHTAYTLLSKQFSSCTVGHSHTFDFCMRTRADGGKIMAADVGCYQDYTNDWAGEMGKLWDRGILIKRNVENGSYDPEWISLASIKKEYA